MSHLEEQTKMLEKRLTRLEPGARQPLVAMEADGHANTKTQKRTEGAATAVQAMSGDSCTTEKKVQDGPKSRTSRFFLQGKRFGRERRYVARVMSPILGDALINSSWWLSFHRRSLHSHRDHLQRATSSVLRDRGDESKGEKIMDFNSIRSYDSSVFQERNLSATPYCPRVVEAKPRQNRTFDPCGSRGHLRACPFLRSWRTLVRGEVVCTGAAG